MKNILVFLAVVLLSAGCAQNAAETAPAPASATPPPISALPSPPNPAPTTQAQQLMITSSAFTSGGAIPSKYSCDGKDINPPLAFSGAPEGTKSFALIMNDPDAVPVVGYVIDHWVLWNIPADTTNIAENSVPAGAAQGKSYSAKKYQGPCPPPGTTHRYHFKLYALDVAALDLPTSTTGKKLEEAMKGHLLQKAEIVARYTAR